MYRNWEEYCTGEIKRTFESIGVNPIDVKVMVFDTGSGFVQYIGRFCPGDAPFWNENDKGTVSINHPSCAEFPYNTN